MVEVAEEVAGVGVAVEEEDGRVEAGVYVSIRRYPNDLAEVRLFIFFILFLHSTAFCPYWQTFAFGQDTVRG